MTKKTVSHTRPTWEEYFMDIMEAVSKRATCDRGRSGCAIARDNLLLSTGYVGSPKGSPHCDEVGHLMKKLAHENGTVSEHCMRTAHAEANAICQAAKNGIPINGATVYCRMTPCRNCAMLIVNSGIKSVIAERDYHDSADSKQIFDNANVELIILNKEIQRYTKKS
ncbi:MAG: cytidine/deoxycytidylate deaminase family protein [Candidatus Nomurabacteria bacterium]|jgi:dCMP deaminase|nr:cytidine/deoxycytidylate deaminase family protein [Candidatus Nomurabacteria bacterium]